MECITDKQRKMIFALAKCYSKYVYESDDSFHVNQSLTELKKKYQQTSSNVIIEPFSNLRDKILKVLDKTSQTQDKEVIADEIERLLVREVQFFKIKIEGVFSISSALFSKNSATKFIDWLIGYFVYEEIELSPELLKMLEDQQKEKLVYAALMNGKCCVCGRKASLHHAKSVGFIGGYAKDKGQLPVSPLCKEHHAEIHTIGPTKFKLKYHTYGSIKLSDRDIEKVKKVYSSHFLAFSLDGGDELDG